MKQMTMIENLASVCSECGRIEAERPPKYDRDDERCYARVQGRSRRAERSCLRHTIRALRQQLANAENELRRLKAGRPDDVVKLPA